MNDSFPSSGGEQWPQFEEPNQDRQDNINESAEHLETTPIRDLGQKALEAMEPTDEGFTDTVDEDQSAETTSESIPTIDTAESLAERQEKLKKGIKIVIGGPPHSGKSVFIEALTQNLDKDHTFSFSAAISASLAAIISSLALFSNSRVLILSLALFKSLFNVELILFTLENIIESS